MSAKHRVLQFQLGSAFAQIFTRKFDSSEPASHEISLLVFFNKKNNDKKITNICLFLYSLIIYFAWNFLFLIVFVHWPPRFGLPWHHYLRDSGPLPPALLGALRVACLTPVEAQRHRDQWATAQTGYIFRKFSRL
jgi:hypothetical protein